MNKKPEYWYNQSAVIPYRIKSNFAEVLLITSRRKQKWIIPKGIIENGLSPAESAAKEALEEAGIKGRVKDKVIGEYKYKKWGGVCIVKVYAMNVDEVLDKWEEDFRTRKWTTIKNARKLIENENIVKLLTEFKKTILE